MINKNFSNLTSYPASGLNGSLIAPGDKSVSHRALLFGALAVGETQIKGLLESDDIYNTLNAIRDLGAKVEVSSNLGSERNYVVYGRGVGGLIEPDNIIDMGNAGTGARLISGVLSAHNFTSTLTGDPSLRQRPMSRVIEPLSLMGARFEAKRGDLLPMSIQGTNRLIPLVYESPVPSAQVKSAVLIAGIHARGKTTVIEKVKTRDHTERLLSMFGAEVSTDEIPSKKHYEVTVSGYAELVGKNLMIPGDPSSVAFLIVATLITDNSKLTVRNVGLNPERMGLFKALKRMGGRIKVSKLSEECGEPVGDITVESSELKGVNVSSASVPSMIDEIPILSIAASCADGQTRIEGLRELRFKESDRLNSIAEGLKLCGVKLEIEKDNLIIHGCAGRVKGNAIISTNFDHRIAMSFSVLGLSSMEPIAVDDTSSISTSYPKFISDMNSIGANLKTLGNKEFSQLNEENHQ